MYCDTYGTDDLSDEDKDVINNVLGNNFTAIQNM